MNRPRVILFDMDGTLTRPVLDFDAIRADLGITGPILEAIAQMNATDAAVAREKLDRHETRAALEAELNDGCHALLDSLAGRGIRTALITRNSLRSVRAVLDKHAMRFELVLSRDCTTPKPDPAPLRLACERLGVSTRDAWMVGDGSHDIEAAVAAEVRGVWLSHGRRRDFAAVPWREIATLGELSALLDEAG